ncbi:MAG TPA: hypothetical protein HPP97_00180 [Desulfuromonadales bacterium]|nr:hypothetical protein [Desulfuromonadales bacterium]
MNIVICTRFIHTICISALLSLLIASTGLAGGLPGSGGHYPNGAEDFMVGALPPPGTYLVNYMLLVQKDSLKNNSGSTAADINFSVFAEVPRLIYVSPYSLFGASLAAQVFIPYYSADLTAPALGNLNVNDKGMGDIIFSPLVLGWHFSPELHAVAALDIWAPTGNYDKTNLATQVLSKNHWTFEPVLAVSYLKDGFDASIKLMYDFNTENDDYLMPGPPGSPTVKLSPGQEFHMDWALGYSAKNGLTGGLVGYNYWQTTDNEVNGSNASDGKSQVGGIGVGLKYWPKQGPFSVTLKQYWEYNAKNMPTGPQSVFKIIYAF